MRRLPGHNLLLMIATLFMILGWVVPIAALLGLLIFVHELGHFLAAKFFGMRVEQFSIGFPPRILGKKIGETEYRLGAIPLGGYVKISGMIDETMDTEFANSEPKPWEFRAKPVWQRVIVISAGVVFNVVLAALIFIGLKWHYGDVVIPADQVQSVYVAPTSLAEELGFRTGDRIAAVNERPLESYDDFRSLRALTAEQVTFTVVRDGAEVTLEAPRDLMSRLNAAEGDFGFDIFPSLVGGVQPGSPAARHGLQAGDRIVALDGEPIQFWRELVDRLQAGEGAPVAVQFVRPDSLQHGAAPQFEIVSESPAGTVYEVTLEPDTADGRYLIGIHIPTPDQLRHLFEVQERRYALGQAVVEGSRETVGMVGLYGVLVKRLFTGQDPVRESVGGPLMIAKVTKDAADRGLADWWRLAAIISIALAVFNILPIPVLDGGQLVFLLYEGITRREPSLRFRMVVQQIGLVLILAFMAFVIFNDAMRIF